MHIDGGLRPRLLVRARKLHPSAKLTLEQLALVETLGIGCHAVSRGRPQSGDHVLIIGAGPIGLSVIESVKLAGSSLTVADINEGRLAFCRDTIGVDQTVTCVGDGSELKRFQEITNGALFTVVIDATGNAESMSYAWNCVAHAGEMVYVGITTEEVRVPDPLFHRREITLFASRNALPDDFKRIIRFIEEGQIDTRPWINHRTAFDSMIAQFPSYTRPETGVIKAMVEVD